MGVRIVTWNVNGIRNPFSYEPWRSKRSFATMFDILEADIVIFQETKIQRKDLRDDMVLIPGWDCYFSFPGREKGKFGVVIYTRQSTCAPIRAEEGLTGTLRGANSNTPFCELPEDQQIGGYPTPLQMVTSPGAPDIAADFDTLDSEGRVVILEFSAFVLFGVYAPASRDETRVAYRAGFFNLLDARIRNLVKLGKRVVLTGDLNVSKEPLDVANIEADLRKSGTTVEEYFGTATRRMFNHLVIGGNVSGDKDEGRADHILWDVCRSFHPEREGMYTHWETKKNARPGNFGSRIDYILCTEDMKDWFSESNIQEGLMGSDHCPVFAIMKDEINVNGKMVHTLDAMNPPGMFKDGKRLREHAQKDILPTSGRLIPDFTGRQSIRDMFAKRPSLKPAPTSEVSAGSPTHEPSSTNTTNNPVETKEQPRAAAEPAAHVGAAALKAAPKRPLPEKTAPARATKKAKGSTGAASASPSKGQSQIMGFFKRNPKPDAKPETAQPHPVTTPSSPSGAHLRQDIATHLESTDIQESVLEKQENTRQVELKSEKEVGRSSAELKPAPIFEDPARDLEQSKTQWAQLLSKPQVPQCEHGEPCKQMLSKKQGQNFMRYFYMCARPLGPSGDKEVGTQWRCRTFIWCSAAK